MDREPNGEASLREAGAQLKEDFHMVREAVGRRAEDVRETVVSFVDEHPLASVGAAFGIGYLLAGGLWSRPTARMVKTGARLALATLLREALAGGALDTLAEVFGGRREPAPGEHH